MNAASATSQKPGDARRGFDAPAITRETDYLNRWPLAREIVGIATTGPQDWSVRVGIYGEWGTGKTSVLKFITQIAEKDGHIVVWFDPWEHSSRSELWRAFVSTVFENLKAKLGKVPGANSAKAKEWAEKAGRILSGLTATINEGAGRAVEGGLDLVKKHFTAGASDFKAIQPILGDKRVIVLIDDLDRTAPKLVPEILFALKELMDIPGFSFVSAFDPVVVGEILGNFHPGFGNGLKFLDKIIDYPRWLTKPSAEGLAKMAMTEAAISCPYVPTEAVADAVRLLPANPRAVRQFIRLLALLKPQIERHDPHELNWSAIIAANILKVRHPRLAHELLDDDGFWRSIGVIGLSVRGEDEKGETAKAVNEHITSVSTATGHVLTPTETNEITSALMSLCSEIGLIGRLNEEAAAYQFNLAEAPAAVTWKEFDAFLISWQAKQSTKTVTKWLAQHAATVEQTEQQAYRELLQAVVQRYTGALHQADNAFTQDQSKPFIDTAKSLFALLDTLVFKHGRLDQPEKWIGQQQLERLVDSFARIAGARMPVHVEFWPRNEALIIKLFEKWSADVMPLIKVLQPYAGIRLRNFDGEESGELHEKLCAVVLPHFAEQLADSFRQNRFIQRLMRNETDTFDSRCVVLDARGPLWTSLRTDVFEVLAEAPSNQIVHENAYDLLHWFILAGAEHAPDIEQKLQKLFSDQAIFNAVWQAATASQLGPRAVYHIKELPGIMRNLDINCPLPGWWAPIVATFTISAPAKEPEALQPPDTEAPGESPEPTSD